MLPESMYSPDGLRDVMSKMMRGAGGPFVNALYACTFHINVYPPAGPDSQLD